MSAANTKKKKKKKSINKYIKRESEDLDTPG